MLGRGCYHFDKWQHQLKKEMSIKNAALTLSRASDDYIFKLLIDLYGLLLLICLSFLHSLLDCIKFQI